MALYIPHSIFHSARLLYVRPETFGRYYVQLTAVWAGQHHWQTSVIPFWLFLTKPNRQNVLCGDRICPSVRHSVCDQVSVTTAHDGFSWNSVPKLFTIHCRRSQRVFKSGSLPFSQNSLSDVTVSLPVKAILSGQLGRLLQCRPTRPLLEIDRNWYSVLTTILHPWFILSFTHSLSLFN